MSADSAQVKLDNDELEFLITPYAASFGPVDNSQKRPIEGPESESKRIKQEEGEGKNEMQSETSQIPAPSSQTPIPTAARIPELEDSNLDTELNSQDNDPDTEAGLENDLDHSDNELHNTPTILTSDIIKDPNTPLGLLPEQYQRVLLARSALENLEKLVDLDNEVQWEEQTMVFMSGLTEIQNKWNVLETMRRTLLPKPERKNTARRARGRGRGRGRGRARK